MQHNHVVGFGSTDEQNLDNIKKQLQSHLRPEFINRLDEIVMFNSLNQETCKRILNNELKKFTDRMELQQVKLSISTQVKRLLLEQGFDKKYGARPLRRIIQSKVQTPLAKFLLEHERPVVISALVDQDTVKIEHKKASVVND